MFSIPGPAGDEPLGRLPAVRGIVIKATGYETPPCVSILVEKS